MDTRAYSLTLVNVVIEYIVVCSVIVIVKVCDYEVQHNPEHDIGHMRIHGPKPASTSACICCQALNLLQHIILC